MAHTSLNVEDDLLKKAKEKGLNITRELNIALKRKLGEEIPRELIKMKCHACGAIITDGYWCPDSLRAWCKGCHEKINMQLVCREYHKNYGEGKERLHFHNPFGNVPVLDYGKTIKDIEKGNAEHQINGNNAAGGF